MGILEARGRQGVSMRDPRIMTTFKRIVHKNIMSIEEKKKVTTVSLFQQSKRPHEE